jgi:hypothetical protein
MTDIDQNRFALMTTLTRAHIARPDDYPNPGTLVGMSDESLRSYAAGLLHALEATPRSDKVATRLQDELRGILRDTL